MPYSSPFLHISWLYQGKGHVFKKDSPKNNQPDKQKPPALVIPTALEIRSA